MNKLAWSDADQIVALYLARRGSSDAEIEGVFLKETGHTLKSLNMAISNFHHLLGRKGLKNVSARQRKIHAKYGFAPIAELRAQIVSNSCGSPVISKPVSTHAKSSGRRLTDFELGKAREILALVRVEISKAADGDEALRWALRRKVYKELVYDERSKPMARRLLKAKLFARQHGLCADCKQSLPEKYSVLDRFEAMKGYADGNCRLVCTDCDRKTQEGRRYT